MKRAVVFTLVALALTTAAALVLSRLPGVQDWFVRRAAERALSPSAAVLEGDGLRVLLCGTSSPLPSPDRAQACVAVVAGGRFYVVDVGMGSAENLALWRVPGERVGAVFLTHFHSDHIGDLGELNLQTWVAGRTAPLSVYGPPGVELVVRGFEEAQALDRDYRVAHHGADFVDPEIGRMRAIEFRPGDAGVEVLNEGGLRVTSFSVDHRPIEPAVGYRFDYRGRSVVVSGDTVKNAALIEAARGADVLVHEALAPHLVAIIGAAAHENGRERIARIMADIPDYHTSPVEAAMAANEAGASLLVLYHLVPAPPPLALAERGFLRGVAEVRPDGVVLADDGLLVDLPPESSEIEISHID